MVISRTAQLDELAEALPPTAAALVRVVLMRSGVQMSRTEAGVLVALQIGPRRITELAAREGVTQPAITTLVNRLEERGWVRRQADPNDGRAVLVALTTSGREVLGRLRAEYRTLFRTELATLITSDVHALTRAVEILGALIQRLTGEWP